MEWQPIETAPKDERILVYQDGAMHVAHHKSHGIVFAIVEDRDNAYVCTPPPTHWMPLPPPPSE